MESVPGHVVGIPYRWMDSTIARIVQARDLNVEVLARPPFIVADGASPGPRCPGCELDDQLRLAALEPKMREKMAQRGCGKLIRSLPQVPRAMSWVLGYVYPSPTAEGALEQIRDRRFDLGEADLGRVVRRSAPVAPSLRRSAPTDRDETVGVYCAGKVSVQFRCRRGHSP